MDSNAAIADMDGLVDGTPASDGFDRARPFHHNLPEDQGDQPQEGDPEMGQSNARPMPAPTRVSQVALEGRQPRVSESASTVRALPRHVVEELERLRLSRDDGDSEEGTVSIIGGEGTEGSLSGWVDTPTTSQLFISAAEEHRPHETDDPNQAPAPPQQPFMMPTTASMTSTAFSFFPSMPPSPRLTGADTSALPSPPSSPADSVSSLPSVSSSFFFSSAAASPRLGMERTLSGEGQQRDRSEHSRDEHQDHTEGGVKGEATAEGKQPQGAPPAQRRRRTIRQQRSYQDESSFSSLESSPSSLELIAGARGHSRARRGVWPQRAGRQQIGDGHSSDAAGAAGLVIPSLMLPPALKRPTPYGQTLGEVRLLVLARQGHAVHGRGFLASLLLDNNEDVVEVGEWEDPADRVQWAGNYDDEVDEEMVQLGKAGAKVLRASTDWIEHTDAHGLEKYEPMRNVEVVELPSYDVLTEGNTLIEHLKNVVHAPFHSVSEILHPDSQPSAVLANLVGSASTPLLTAFILLLPSAMTPFDRRIVDTLGPHVPIIVLPASAVSSASTFSSYPVSSSSSFSTSFPASPHLTSSANFPEHEERPSPIPTAPPLVLSSFRPQDATALKQGLFHSPETLATLRMEAAGRFLRWREVERVVRGLSGGSATTRARMHSDGRSLSRGGGERREYGMGWRGWDKERWEREWMGEFSRDVAVGIADRERRMEGLSGDETDIEDETLRSPGQMMEASSSDSIVNGKEEYNEIVERSEDVVDEEYLLASRVTAYTHSHPFDPLHLPSFLLFTASMLGPLRARVVEMLKRVIWTPFTIVFHPVEVSPSPAHSSPTSEQASKVSEKRGSASEMTVVPESSRRKRQSSNGGDADHQKWMVVGGMVGVGFCVGVGVGVVAARTTD
ncbi:hypothetical protein DFP72DRAFT_1071739 [Ephemerocybe angulata]|uniref:Uncharacterized protein n=1 Tax=Ephemerocybe angulata TaxID=980116 RepID=A0A8H6HRP5_9AGAR|nr:hypothetical protein DFP72DRAFT_1071739 [Tulosesus angulatus]